MGLLADIFSSQASDFADMLVNKIARQFPPTSEPQLAKKGAQRRLEDILQHVMNDLDAYNADKHPGWVGKARLGNAFRWKLIDRGYSKLFVEALTEGLIRHIAAK